MKGASCLHIHGLPIPADAIDELRGASFATVLPALRAPDERFEVLIHALVDLGCAEIYSFGPHAGSWHDDADWIIESREALSIVTTSDEAEPRISDYLAVLEWQYETLLFCWV